MLNKILLMGRICNNLELKFTPNGVEVLQFRIAVERNYKDVNGERQTDFIGCVAWRGTAKFIADYFSKGRLILVEGAIQTRNYTDKDNRQVYVTEVVVDSVSFTGEKSETTKQVQTQAPPSDPPAYTPPPSNSYTAEDFARDTDDEYPF